MKSIGDDADDPIALRGRFKVEDDVTVGMEAVAGRRAGGGTKRLVLRREDGAGVTFREGLETLC